MAPPAASPVLRFIRRIAGSQETAAATDGQLLERFAQKRDEAAFALLVDRLGPLVLSVCRRVLHHEQDAEDAFQATFLVLARKAGSIGKRESVGSWLYGVAWRIAAKARANAARRRRLAGEVRDMPAVEPDAGIIRRDLQAVLDEEMQRLPAKYRSALVLCYVQGMSTDQAAEELGTPRGTVGTRVARGRALLRTRLARRGLALSGAVLATTLMEHSASTAVPSSLALTTVQTAVKFAAGQALAAGAVSPQVALLTKGALQAMFFVKLKVTLAVVLAIGLAGTTAGVVSQALAGRPGPETGVGPAAVATADDQKKEDKDDPLHRQASQFNLKQLGIAMHNYHDANNAFPTHAIYSQDGKPLLSWRVALLPYLGEDQLYKQFKLDEPWDSDHNKKLLAKMPLLFAPPGVKTKKPSTTMYQVFVGPGTIFDGKQGTRMAGITDGTSNTILMAESGEEVEWTRPQDIPVETGKKLPRINGFFREGQHVLFADGSVHFLPKNYDEDIFRLCILRASGEVKDVEALTKGIKR